jgi:hypothetical protein
VRLAFWTPNPDFSDPTNAQGRSNAPCRLASKPLGNEAVVVELDRTKSVPAAEFAELRNQKLIFVMGRTITIPKPRELEELFKQNVGDI